jgi:hypothetical protein
VAAREPGGIIFRGKIAHKCRHTKFPFPEDCERFLEERRLSRARTRDETHHENAGVAKPLPQGARNEVIPLQHVFAHLDDAPWHSLLYLQAHYHQLTTLDDVARQSAALRAGKGLQRVNRALRIARWTENKHRNFFYDELRTFECCVLARHFERRNQRIFDHAGKESHSKVHRFASGG